jgi:hypothetical protein
MVRKSTFFLAMSLFPLATLSVPAHSEVREMGDSIEVWHLTAAGRVGPDEFLVIEITRIKGSTYGTVENDLANDTAQERNALVVLPPDTRGCPMAFNNEHWRRLPDVLAHDEGLRKSGGCKGVFRF